MTATSEMTGVQLFELFRKACLSFTKPRSVSSDVLLQFGDKQALVRVREGRVAEVIESGVAFQSWDFAIKGSVEAWQKFWQEIPPAGWHDILALNKRKAFVIEGRLHPLMAHLQFYKDLLASPRGMLR